MKQPENLLFLGNSYTHRGPIPLLVYRIARSQGKMCLVYEVAPEGASLRDHTLSDEVEYIMRHGGWDVLVLQESSVRVTRTAGEIEEHCKDVCSLAAMFWEDNPDGSICLMQTWPRHLDHLRYLLFDIPRSFYPHEFLSPTAMLLDLREGTEQARRCLLERYPQASVKIAWVGEAWQAYDRQKLPHRLHDEDGHHAGPLGQWLTALVLYRALFGEYADAFGIPRSIPVFCRSCMMLRSWPKQRAVLTTKRKLDKERAKAAYLFGVFVLS